MKKLFPPDMSGTNPANKIGAGTNPAEKQSNVATNVPVYLDHSIFYAESMSIYTSADCGEDKRLVLERDYFFSHLDSIASEQSNKDCYRAIVFTSNHPALWFTYQVYGDLVTIDLMNSLGAGIENAGTEILALSGRVDSCFANLDVHRNTENAHGATAAITPNKIVMRGARGEIKIEPAVDNEDPVQLQQLTTRLAQTAGNLETKFMAEDDKLHKKIKAETPTIVVNDFYPGGVQSPTPAEEAIAQAALTARLSETRPAYNALRNGHGSVCVPAPQANDESTPKIYVDGRDASTLTDAKAYADIKSADTLAAANTYADDNGTSTLAIAKTYADTKSADALSAAKIYTDQTANTLRDELKEHDTTNGAEVATNKYFNGKRVYRRTFQATIPSNNDSPSFPYLANDVKEVIAMGGWSTRQTGQPNTRWPIPNADFEFYCGTELSGFRGFYLTRKTYTANILATWWIEYIKL